MHSILILALLAAALPTDTGFTVHEWGTFTSVAGSDGGALEWRPLAGKSDLPCFVSSSNNGILTKSSLRTTVRMETPVLYFYSQRAMEASVHVDFPNGFVTEWYPQATVSGGITWPSVSIQPGAAGHYPVETAPSHYYAARNTKATPLTVNGQAEKFLFYRGAGSFPLPLTAKIVDGRIDISGGQAILFENRGGLVGYRLIAPGDNVVERPILRAGSSGVDRELASILVAAGLFPDEANAMVETWRDSWFEEGMRVFYFLSQEEVNRILPLSIHPEPAHRTRVFVGRMELITPETKNAVKDIVAQGNWNALARYGRFAEPILTQLMRDEPLRQPQINAAFQSLYSAAPAKSCASH